MAGRKVFHDSIVPLPQQPVLAPHGLIVADAEPDHNQDRMDLTFSFDLSQGASAALEDAIAQGKTIPMQEQIQKFSPSKADLDALSAWLKSEGFEVTK